jgi:hypothetical protein
MANSCADPVSSDPASVPDSGFTLVQRNNKWQKRERDVVTNALEPTQSKPNFLLLEPTKSYSLALSFSKTACRLDCKSQKGLDP